jgi:uncharacterized repeat protein (TIGR03803 family)
MAVLTRRAIMTNPKPYGDLLSGKGLPVANTALTLAVMLVVGIVLTPSVQAQTFSVLHSFTGTPDGSEPIAGLVMDDAGNLYGTTQLGGSSNGGTVFKVDTTGKETVLYNFTDVGTGLSPESNLVRDKAGNLYGTTSQGGGTEWCEGNGCGTVFKVDTTGKGIVLYSFKGGTTDGCGPYGGLVRDREGNLYGTTVTCGVSNLGTVFRVSTSGKETVLHSFSGTDGAYPELTSLIIDAKGNLYGVAYAGGDLSCGGGHGCGVVYKLSKRGTLTVLYSFAGGADGAADGCHPQGTPFMDEKGNLYGTTLLCGSANEGIVWKLNKTGKETVLYSFTGTVTGGDGEFPEAGVIMDAKGNLYGTTIQGGTSGDAGTVYELNEKGTLTRLHSFHGEPDGAAPWGGLIRDTKGNLYGACYLGGSDHNGTVWKLTP